MIPRILVLAASMAAPVLAHPAGPQPVLAYDFSHTALAMENGRPHLKKFVPGATLK